MINNTYTCPLCGSKTKDYFVSMNRDLGCATDIRCANKNCFFSSNYVPFRIWMHIKDVKKNEIMLQRENRMLSESIDKMALKPNQEIIEWHSYPEEKPERPVGTLIPNPVSQLSLLVEYQTIDGGTYVCTDEYYWLNEPGFGLEIDVTVLAWAYMPKGSDK